MLVITMPRAAGDAAWTLLRRTRPRRAGTETGPNWPGDKSYSGISHTLLSDILEDWQVTWGLDWTVL